MKIIHEEVDQELPLQDFLPIKITHEEADQIQKNVISNYTKNTAKLEIDIKKIPRKSIVLENQMEFNLDDDLLNVFSINLILKENIANLNLNDFEIRKDKGNISFKKLSFF